MRRDCLAGCAHERPPLSLPRPRAAADPPPAHPAAHPDVGAWPVRPVDATPRRCQRGLLDLPEYPTSKSGLLLKRRPAWSRRRGALLSQAGAIVEASECRALRPDGDERVRVVVIEPRGIGGAQPHRVAAVLAAGAGECPDVGAAARLREIGHAVDGGTDSARCLRRLPPSQVRGHFRGTANVIKPWSPGA